MEVPMRLSFWSCAIIALLAVSIAPSRAQTSPAKQPPKTPANGIAELPLIDLSGYNKILQKYRGKPLLVTFWATWCEPCRDEFPSLVALAKQYAPQGLSVFGVSLDDNADMNLVRHFLAEFKPGFPNFRQNPQIDVDEFYGGVNPDWQGSMPETIFYSRDGRIVQHFTGGQPRATFEQAIHAILGTHASSKNVARSPSSGN
jgi:thiol-disulfide isomerase/thioredoxin